MALLVPVGYALGEFVHFVRSGVSCVQHVCDHCPTYTVCDVIGWLVPAGQVNKAWHMPGVVESQFMTAFFIRCEAYEGMRVWCVWRQHVWVCLRVCACVFVCMEQHVWVLVSVFVCVFSMCVVCRWYVKGNTSVYVVPIVGMYCTYVYYMYVCHVLYVCIISSWSSW